MKYLPLVAAIASALLIGCAALPSQVPPPRFDPGADPEAWGRIPAGEFLMGTDEGGIEKPVHKVRIGYDFEMGRTEVTVAQFRAFVEATGYTTDAEKGTGFHGAFGWNRDTMEFKMNEKYSWRSTGFTQSDSHPVINVSWNDAAEFCTRLSQREDLKPFYLREGETITFLDGTGYRLPAETEWEFACRAGTSTRFWIGDQAEDLDLLTAIGHQAALAIQRWKLTERLNEEAIHRAIIRDGNAGPAPPWHSCAARRMTAWCRWSSRASTGRAASVRWSVRNTSCAH